MKGKIRKIAAFLLAAVMVVAGINPAQSVKAANKPQFTVKTSTSTVKPGETFTAELWLEPNSGLTSFVLNYLYDTDTFELVSTKKGEYLKELDMTFIDADPGNISILVDFGENPDTVGGQMYILTLKVKDDAAGTGNVGIDFRQGTIPDSDGGNDVVIYPESVEVKGQDKDGNINDGNIGIDIQLESIVLNKTEAFTMAKGTKDMLTVTATPANALEGKTVEWDSSDKSVIEVDTNGNIMAVGAGKATVTAKVGDKTASVNITVNVPLNAIELSKSTLALRKGAEETLDVIFNPGDTTDDKLVKWMSSDSSVASVDAEGKVTALKNGATDITAMVGDKTATCRVTVKEEALTGIELSENTITLAKNTNQVLEVIYTPEDTTDDKSVKWSSENEKVATVKDGVVTAKGAGTTIVTAAVGSFTASCQVNVEVPLETISLSPSEKKLEVGESVTCAVIYNPEDTTDEKTVTWNSTNEDVAVVSDGVVKAVGSGKAEIIATAANGLTAKCQITVPVHTTGIVLETTEMEILKNEVTAPITVTFVPADTEDDKSVAWVSSNPEIASVDENGKVTGVSAGTAVITASAVAGGFTASCKVTVKEVNLEGISLSADTPTNMYKGQVHKLQVGLVPENTTEEVSLAYSSSNEETATVSKDGVITALKEGSTEITVETADGRFATSFTLSVKEIPMEEIAFKEKVTPLEEGQTAKLEILFNPENTTDDRTVLWNSSNEAVATVIDGQLRAYKAGKTVITAKVGEKEISYELTVTAKKLQNQGGDQNNSSNTENIGKPNNTTRTKTVQTGDAANTLHIMLMLIFSVITLGFVMRKRKVVR